MYLAILYWTRSSKLPIFFPCTNGTVPCKQRQPGDTAYSIHERYPTEQLFNAQGDNSKENEMNLANPEVDQKPEIEAESN